MKIACNTGVQTLTVISQWGWAQELLNFQNLLKIMIFCVFFPAEAKAYANQEKIRHVGIHQHAKFGP